MTRAVYENIIYLEHLGSTIVLLCVVFHRTLCRMPIPIIVPLPGSQLATDIQTAEEEYATITSGCANDSEFDETYVLKARGAFVVSWGNGCGFTGCYGVYWNWYGPYGRIIEVTAYKDIYCKFPPGICSQTGKSDSHSSSLRLRLNPVHHISTVRSPQD